MLNKAKTGLVNSPTADSRLFVPGVDGWAEVRVLPARGGDG